MKLLISLLPAVSMAWADWCKWVPVASQQYVPACGGYGYSGYRYPAGAWNYGCANWCQWVPGPSWGYTPDCVGCYQTYSGHYKALSAPNAAPAKATGSGCEASCQWLSRVSWNNTTDCAKCEQPLVLESKQSPEEAAPSPRLKVRMQRPSWCQWVPLGSLQYVGECNTGSNIGTETTAIGGCAGWCGWSPVSSWQYIPECTQCSSATQGTVVPASGCENWCQWVSRPSWQYSGGCAGCEALVAEANAQNQNQNEIRP